MWIPIPRRNAISAKAPPTASVRWNHESPYSPGAGTNGTDQFPVDTSRLTVSSERARGFSTMTTPEGRSRLIDGGSAGFFALAGFMKSSRLSFGICISLSGVSRRRRYELGVQIEVHNGEPVGLIL